MVGALRFHCRGHEFQPWSGNWDPTGHLTNNNNDKILHLMGFLVLHKRSNILLCISLGEDLELCPKVALLFPNCSPPLSLDHILCLISNCMNLPFGAQGSSWRLNEAYFLQIRNRGHKDICVKEVHWVLLGFNTPFSLL